MNLITETKQFYLSPIGDNVIQNNDNFKSHLSYIIPNFISYDKNTLYHSIKISHAEIPYSFYIINDYNNSLIINNISLYVKVGNYNAISLLEHINLLLNETFDFNIILSFDDYSGRYLLTSDQSFIVGISSISKIVGLDNNIYYGLFDYSSSKYILNFPFLVNTLGSKNIYLKSNLLTNNLSLYNQDSTILKSIAINCPPYGIIMYNNENSETMIKNRELNYLEIQLLDDDYNLINFNNINWSICLELKITKQLIINSFSFDDFFNNNLLTNEKKDIEK